MNKKAPIYRKPENDSWSIDAFLARLSAQESYRGLSFTYSKQRLDVLGVGPVHEWVECTISIHDKHTVSAREYAVDVLPAMTGHGTSSLTHPNRLIRHEAIKQAARLAFPSDFPVMPDDAPGSWSAYQDVMQALRSNSTKDKAP